MLINLRKNIFGKIIQNTLYNIFNHFFNKNPLSILSDSYFVNINNIFRIYNENKKIFLNKNDVFFKFLNKNISNMKFELTFLENIDIKKLIKKFERLCSNSYINFISNDIRKKVIEKFKKIIGEISLLYTLFTEISLNYSSFFSNIRIVRAPPVFSKFSFN